ncbi:hypothetical protein GJ744_003046 [Endocarpon pusillum]|uniref:Uncharacterized protein n=1 Tax=Endocarpon pusillum TaxID=364733 RepID=A0A8H7E2B4_9EURO|nr:hypothetical protein GJ744_003046 [Endocarpon pusillum]
MGLNSVPPSPPCPSAVPGTTPSKTNSPPSQTQPPSAASSSSTRTLHMSHAPSPHHTKPPPTTFFPTSTAWDEAQLAAASYIRALLLKSSYHK